MNRPLNNRAWILVVHIYADGHLVPGEPVGGPA